MYIHVRLFVISTRVALCSMLGYIQSAQSKLPLLPSPLAKQKEAAWFLKVAWNLALQCEDNYQQMREFYVACYSLSEVLSTDPSVLLRQKTCQLMAAAASINLGRSADSEIKVGWLKCIALQ